MMEEQELIASGKLELYVAGVLPESEMADIAMAAIQSPLLAMEIEKIEQIMIDFLSPSDIAMQEPEKEEQIDIILEKIRKSKETQSWEADHGEEETPLTGDLAVDLRGELEGSTSFETFTGIDTHAMETARLEAAVASIKLHEPATPKQTFVEKPPPLKIYAILRVLVAAMVIAIILMSGWIAWLIAQNIRMEKQADSLRAEIQRITESTDKERQQIKEINDQEAFMNRPSTFRVELKVAPGTTLNPHNNYMLVFWSPVNQQTLITDASLPALPADKQYQLWGLDHGKPLDAGVFDPQALKDGNLQVKSIASAQAFAVTVEPKGGSAQPTMSTLTLMGKL
jgi:cell division protein FtsB